MLFVFPFTHGAFEKVSSNKIRVFLIVFSNENVFFLVQPITFQTAWYVRRLSFSTIIIGIIVYLDAKQFHSEYNQCRVVYCLIMPMDLLSIACRQPFFIVLSRFSAFFIYRGKTVRFSYAIWFCFHSASRLVYSRRKLVFPLRVSLSLRL